MKFSKIALAVCVVAIPVAILVFLTAGTRLAKLIGRGPADPPEVRLALARSALATTENMQTAEAEPLWNDLHRQMPQDTSVALNRALNRVLHIDLLVEAAANALLEGGEREASRAQLPAALNQARLAIDDYYQLSQDDVMRLWLSSRVDLQEASLLPADQAEALRQDVFSRLSAAVQDDLGNLPRAVILGGTLTRVLDELESPMDGYAADFLVRAAATVQELSDQHDDNLYLALRAARLGIAAKSDRSAGSVARTRELASAIDPVLRAATEPIGLTPGELVQNILDAIDRQQWQTAENQMRLWFNVLNSTELVRTDRRRASPHPLDRLSFDVHRRLAAAVAADYPIVAGQVQLDFVRSGPEINTSGTDGEVVCALAMDVNLDLVPEVVAVSASGAVSLWQSDTTASEIPQRWQKVGELDLAIRCSGLLSADLFMVDASDPGRLQTAGRRDDQDSPPPPERHTTLPTLVAYGEGGVKMVSVDGREATADNHRLSVVPHATGLEDLTQVTTAIAGDLDGDGDLDLVFATANEGIRFFANRGNRTFFEVELTNQDKAMASLTDISAMAIVDLDRDLDLDIVTVDHQSGRVGLIENLLHLQFRYRELGDIPAVASANQVAVAELDGNVSWDIVVGGPEQVQVVYSHTAEAGAWVVDRTESIEASGGRFLLADLDNDSWYELIGQSGNRAVVHRLTGAAAQLADEPGGELRGEYLSSIDFDLSGRLDVLAITEGNWAVYENVTQPVGHHIAVRMRGIDDNNANSGRVNHYAIGSVVELRFGPHYRAQVITSPATHFGLNGFDEPGSLRVIFPNGLSQTINNPPVDMLVEEQQTLKGSCPYLYTWDGEKFAFVTDCLWAAPLGLQVAQGVVAKDRPWEYLKVDGDHVRVRDGRYEFRITEELWEVAYFDHVSLLAVDHPADVDIWTNEKVGPGEIAKPKIHAFASADRLPLRRGVDTYGRDVTGDLQTIDRNYVQGFDRRLRQGLCPPHWIDLDFGDLPSATDGDHGLFLVLTGWILPTDTSLNIQIDQNPDLPAIEFPSLWVPDATRADGWRNAIEFIGFPGGKTKTIVVDVTDSIDRSDPRLRVRTSAQIYWDAAQLVVQSDKPELVRHELDLLAADLHYRGFSGKLPASPRSPQWYDYSQLTAPPMWPPLQGRFSIYGECKSLLEQWDDAMVVMGSGDELRLQFSVPEQKVAEGWKRDFVLHCVGWDKDADLNTLTGQSSEPLPFRNMAQYPPTLSQAEQSEVVNRRNAAHLRRTHRFRDFWSRPSDRLISGFDQLQ